MAAPMDSDSEISSGSEDDEEAKRLKEAIVEASEITENHKSSSKIKPISVTDGRVQSLSAVQRSSSLRTATTSETFDNDFDTTPEVRSFIAKKLSKSLEESIVFLTKKAETTQNEQPQNDGNGFKLFSKKTQKEIDKKLNAKRRKIQEAREKRLKRKSSTDSSDEDAKLAEAAVSVDFIMQHSGINSSSVTLDTEEPTKHSGSPDCQVSSVENETQVKKSKKKNSQDTETVPKSKFKKNKKKSKKLSESYKIPITYEKTKEPV